MADALVSPKDSGPSGNDPRPTMKQKNSTMSFTISHIIYCFVIIISLSFKQFAAILM